MTTGAQIKLHGDSKVKRKGNTNHNPADELGGLRDIQGHLDECTAQLIATREQLQQAHNVIEHQARTQAEVDRVLAEVMDSPSWKLTKPLRSAKSVFGPRS